MGFFRFAGFHMDLHEISVARAMGLFDQIACILARMPVPKLVCEVLCASDVAWFMDVNTV
jgi:hypothetical protein